jgi:cell pole-organizing protein PopZ
MGGKKPDMPDDEREPTMEEILASIRRIIAEEDDGLKARSDADATDIDLLDENGEPFEASESELLELAQAQPLGDEDRIISDETEATASQKVSALSAMLVRGYEGSPDTLEGMVRELLTPMLKNWLDANLPEIVERMVAREIARITRK